MDADEEDFVFFGTPIEREEEMTSRKKKVVAETAGQMRSLPIWKQEVTDEEGRRRFHGAFTGGFSAGYYNTVGSKEGWTPQSFTSSRKKRAEMKEQSIYSFLDDDEKAELEGQRVGTSSMYDTFGFTAAEVARKQAEKEVKNRPSAIPGPVPDELVTPAASSIGIKLLLKMGWRHGRAIKDVQDNSLYDARREARKALIAFSSDRSKTADELSEPALSDSENATEGLIDDEKTFFSRNLPVYVLHPKQDLHGLGFDPFKHAPEFRERKKLQASMAKGVGERSAALVKEKLFSSNSGKVAPGFGIGALEELDVEDEDIYASGFEFEEVCAEEPEEPQTVSRDTKPLLTNKRHGDLAGFKVATTPDYQLERFPPPDIPSDFDPHHKFPGPLETVNKVAEHPPPEAPPPDDNSLRILIEGFASLVSRCGKLFEDLSREKNKANPLFSFLNGGNGYDFYVRKLWELQQKRRGMQKLLVYDTKTTTAADKMTAESRGRILGEKPLERSIKDSSDHVDSVHLQFNLVDTFTKPSPSVALPEAAKPFKDDPAKQERFEQFLKDKYQGGLRSTTSAASNNMSEDDRARERLDFEATAEAIEKGKWSKTTAAASMQQVVGTQFVKQGQFVSSGGEVYKPQNEEKKVETKYPRREEYSWRPYPVLCKRFDIPDPFMGKPLPSARPRSRLDSLVSASDIVLPAKSEETTTSRDISLASHFESKGAHEEIPSEVTENEPNQSVERPVDLYKAIFSDDSDDDDEDPLPSQGDDGTEKKTEIANTTLNRLIAGDFLESLGKELGLEVPPEPQYYSTEKSRGFQSSHNENLTRDDALTASRNNKVNSTNKLPSAHVDGKDDENPKKQHEGKTPADQLPEAKYGKKEREEMLEDVKTRSHKRRHRSRSSNSDTSYSSDSDDYRDRGLSRPKEEHGGSSSRRKSGKHSKHHKHRSKGSSGISHYHDSESEEKRREKRKPRAGREDWEEKREKRKSKSSSHTTRRHH